MQHHYDTLLKTELKRYKTSFHSRLTTFNTKHALDLESALTQLQTQHKQAMKDLKGNLLIEYAEREKLINERNNQEMTRLRDLIKQVKQIVNV